MRQPAVAGLRKRIRQADGVPIATPEYNFSIPGGLKNAIDWVSRVDDQPFALKPVAMLSASPGPVGGARMQYDLRKVLVFMNTFTVNKPEVFINLAAGKFNAQGELTDETTAKFITDLLVAMQNLKQRVG